MRMLVSMTDICELVFYDMDNKAVTRLDDSCLPMCWFGPADMGRCQFMLCSLEDHEVVNKRFGLFLTNRLGK